MAPGYAASLFVQGIMALKRRRRSLPARFLDCKGNIRDNGGEFSQEERQPIRTVPVFECP